MFCIQYTTHIERVPGDRPHTVAFDAYVDGSMLGSFPTRAAAQEALDEYRYVRMRRQQPLLPDEPLSGSELATLWASDRNAALRFLAELSASDLLVQAVLHSQWLIQQHNTLIEPVEIVRRYQQAVAVFLHDHTPTHQTPLKQAA